MHQVTDVVCPGCACTCDDLTVTVEDNQLVSVTPHCPLGEQWFRRHASATHAAAEIHGEPADLRTAIERAAAIIRNARYPLIYGLSRSSTPGQKAAVELADRIGAVVDTTASICHGPSIMALQAVGESTCSLGEIRHRGDLVIFWGCNPSETHPRHAERYSVHPQGQFLPNGRADRTVVMVGDARQVHTWRLDPQGSLPDLVIPIEPGRDFEALTTLRALLKGLPFEGELSVRQTGADLQQLKDLVERMRSCRCGIVFFGLGLTETGLGMTPDSASTDSIDDVKRRSRSGHKNVEWLLRLVAELNAVTRFHARRMRLQGDVSGADTVLCWQTGFPFSVDLCRDYPRYNPGEFSANDLLERAEPDVCVLVGCETVPDLRPAARAYLKRIPTILIDYPSAELSFEPTVRITTSVYGLHSVGTIYRMDETPLELRPSLSAEFPTDASVLTELLRAIQAQPSVVSEAD